MAARSLLSRRVARVRAFARFVDDAGDERLAHFDLLEGDEFVGLVRIADGTGTADHRLEAGTLELTGLRCESDLAAAAVSREPLDALDHRRALFGVKPRIVGLRLELDRAFRRDRRHRRNELGFAVRLQSRKQAMRIVL